MFSQPLKDFSQDLNEIHEKAYTQAIQQVKISIHFHLVINSLIFFRQKKHFNFSRAYKTHQHIHTNSLTTKD